MSLQRKAVNRIYVKRNTVCVNANSFCVRNNLTMLSLSESMLRANPEMSLQQAYTNQKRHGQKPCLSFCQQAAKKMPQQNSEVELNPQKVGRAAEAL